MINILRKALKYVLPVAVIAIALVSARLISANKPEARTRDIAPSVAVVDATRLSSSTYPVVIRSQGTVQPTLANTLVPAVAGIVTEINEAFVVGGMFKRGDILMQIDQREYEIALIQARANHAQADAQYREEKALGEQARTDWRSMGRSGEPSSLTLREPQLASAEANQAATLAQVERAELDLQRTRIIAPYDGIVSERLVDPGQFVGLGVPVGSIHSVHAVDVRLPLSNRQLTYLALPDASTTPKEVTQPLLSNVELRASIGAVEQVWSGKLIRAEGIDATTQQLNVIARVQNPYTQGARPLRVGQFVQARLQGEVLEDVFVIPRAALRESREVLIIDANDEIQRRQVTVAWSDDELVAISEGLSEGELLVVTPMSTVTDGTPVRATIDGVAPAPLES